MIKSVKLIKKFGSQTVLGPISLDLEVRGILGLLGPDGAGKTTLLRIICGIMDPSGGSLAVDGIDVKKDPERVKQKIGYMPQKFSLYGDLTVMENMLFYADLYMVPAKERDRTIERLLKFSNLNPFVNRRAENLSGGMKQKLGLSCALIHKPQVLILDEPTNGVDPLSRQEFWQILKELKDEGVFIMISTPYMDEAERCDSIILINKGVLLHHGPPAGFKKKHRGYIADISTSDNQKAAGILNADPRVFAVNDYGQILHLNCSRDFSIDDIRKTMGTNNIKVIKIKRIAPGIEDVFIYMVNTLTDAGGSARPGFYK